MRWVIGMLLALTGFAANAQEIVLRHALEGKALDALATLVVRFNDAQETRAKVVLQDAQGLEDRRRLPTMALLDTDDSMHFFDTRPRFRPLHQVMAESGEKFDRRRFYPQIAGAVDDSSGRLQALPLGFSVPVLMWNKTAFGKAGLDPDTAPATWLQVQHSAGALFDSGVRCPLTSSRFSRIHLENVSAQHNEPIIVRPNRIALNSLTGVKHLALLSSWHKSSYFRYYGPRLEGDAHFLSGECAMLTGESGLYIKASRGNFPIGIASLPYYDDIYGAAPRNVLPDGAGLWLLAGKKKDEYRLAARFIVFLMRPQNQRDWVSASGYLPMTVDAVTALRESGVPRPLLEAVERRLSMPGITARPKAGSVLDLMRDALNEEVEFVWRNEKPAKEALDTAMRRVNGAAAVRRR